MTQQQTAFLARRRVFPRGYRTSATAIRDSHLFCPSHLAFSAFCQPVSRDYRADQFFHRSFITGVALPLIMTTAGEEGNGNTWPGKNRVASYLPLASAAYRWEQHAKGPIRPEAVEGVCGGMPESGFTTETQRPQRRARQAMDSSAFGLALIGVHPR